MVSEFLRICHLWFRIFCVIYEWMKEERDADPLGSPTRYEIPDDCMTC